MYHTDGQNNKPPHISAVDIHPKGTSLAENASLDVFINKKTTIPEGAD